MDKVYTIKEILEMVKKEEISISEGIRVLNRMGVSRWEISKLIDRKYQQVRNILEREIEVNKRKEEREKKG